MFTFAEGKCTGFDPVQLQLLVAQTAANVLFVCEHRNPAVSFKSPDEDIEGLYDPIAHRLSGYMNWADPGYTNTLQAMAELLYDFVQAQVDGAFYAFMGKGEYRIITDALAAYQTWKTAYIAAEKSRLGPGYETFGDATGFNQKDWTNLNEQFLGILAR